MSEETPPTGDRLQKILARAGLGSRRQMETWIEEGRVTVNGQTATLGQRADLATDAVKVDGRRVQAPSAVHKYVLLNKPPHHVSTLSDPEGRPTIMDLVPHRLHSGLVPVGRLDYDSEGLLLLTDDGELAHRVAHPRYGCTKTYEVKVKGRPSAETLARLEGGMMLYGRPTAPVTIAPHRLNKPSRESQSNSWWRVTLGEGRTRQIREMFYRLGHPVARLRRVAIGSLRDPQLALGSWRFLSEQEVEALRQRTAKAVAPAKPLRKTRRSGAAARRRPRGGAPRRLPTRPGDEGPPPGTERPPAERRPPERSRPEGDRDGRRGGDNPGRRAPGRDGASGDRPRRGPGGERGSGRRGGPGNSERRGPGGGSGRRGPGGGGGRRGPGGAPGGKGSGRRGPGGRSGGKGSGGRGGGRGGGRR